MNLTRFILAIATYLLTLILFLWTRSAGWSDLATLWLLLVVAVLSAVIFWGDAPNLLIFLIAGLGGDFFFWLVGLLLRADFSVLSGWGGFLLWGITGVIFWKGASTIRSLIHPQEYNPYYLKRLGETFREASPDSYKYLS